MKETIGQLEKELILMGEPEELIQALHKTYREEYGKDYEIKYTSHLNELMKKYYGAVKQ
jgi:hypothetical protein